MMYLHKTYLYIMIILIQENHQVGQTAETSDGGYVVRGEGLLSSHLKEDEVNGQGEVGHDLLNDLISHGKDKGEFPSQGVRGVRELPWIVFDNFLLINFAY